MALRHEHKFLLEQPEDLPLRAKLRAAFRHDIHAGESGEYFVRSLYFDDPVDTALNEKLDGMDRREKFRIRYYNGDLSKLFLEKKSKIGGLCEKRSAPMTLEWVKALLDGDADKLLECGDTLVQEFYLKWMAKQLRPKTVVDYYREPFIFPAGNVRVTLDRDIRTGAYRTDFLKPGYGTLPAGDRQVVFEVKYDGFLPDPVRCLVQDASLRETECSKYAHCRIFG